MRDLQVEVITTTRSLTNFVPEWTELHARDGGATPFQHPAWLLPWWNQFGSEELCSVAMFSGKGLMAFLPLYIYTEPDTRERKLMPLGVGTTDYLDGVFAPECLSEDVARALQWLSRQQRWDTMVAGQLRGASRLREAALRLGAAGYATEGTSVLPSSSIAGLPTKIRRTAMYYGNAARRQGALALEIAGKGNCLAGFDALVRLHSGRWQERGGQGVLADARVLAWHREALPRLAGAGLLRLYSLLLDGESIAVMYALADAPQRTHRTTYFYLPGFSMRHAELRPGTLLMAAAIEHAAAEGIQTIDLLRGDEPYKQHWRAERRLTYGCSLSHEGLASTCEPERMFAA